MWRYLAGAVAALLLAAAGLFLFNARGSRQTPALSLPFAAQASPAAAQADPLPDTVPEASAKTREEKRFGRYDKDKNGSITREEYLANRRKAFARLDLNHDGSLGFDEWAAKTEAKFATADGDRNGQLTPAEFATTAVKRKAPSRPRCACPQTPPPARDEDDAG